MNQRPMVAALLSELELLQSEVVELTRRLDQVEARGLALQAGWEEATRRLTEMDAQLNVLRSARPEEPPLFLGPHLLLGAPGPVPQAAAPKDDAEGARSMTLAEWAVFHEAVRRCWTVDPGRRSGAVAVTVEFDLDRNARVAGEVRLLGHDGEGVEAAEGALRAAQRAILLCQTQGGFPLAPEKYDAWRRVQMTFDSRRMTIE
jgi:hypothetical protein